MLLLFILTTSYSSWDNLSKILLKENSKAK